MCTCGLHVAYICTCMHEGIEVVRGRWEVIIYVCT